MSNEEKVLEQLTALTRSHEAFVAEWRAARDEAKAKTEQIVFDSKKRREGYDRTIRSSKLALWVVVAVVAAYFLGPALLRLLVR